MRNKKIKIIFPFYIKISKNFPKHEKTEDVLSQIEKFVLDKNVKNIKINSNKLIFKTNFFVWNWDYFALIEKGVFIVTENKLIFEFSMFRQLFLAIVISILPFFQTKNLYISIFFFIVIGVGNWLVAIIRYKKMLNKMVAQRST